MPLGAYAIIRFANDVRDERVNVGVLVWHPIDGFRFRSLSSLDRVKAINPDIQLKDLQETIKSIRSRTEAQEAGRGLFDELADEYREGLQISGLFPARLGSLEATTDRLYSLLVDYPSEKKPEHLNFQVVVESAIANFGPEVDPNGSFEYIGRKPINGVDVEVGYRTKIRQHDFLWRAVSLRTQAKEDQLARAKSVVADIMRVKTVAAYSSAEHIVALENAKIPQRAILDECKKWITSIGAEPLVIPDSQAAPQVIRDRLMAA